MLQDFETMPVIFIIFSKFQFIVIIAVDTIYWKTTLAKIVLDSDQLPGSYYEMHSGQYIQIHIEASWSRPPSTMATFFHMNFL